MPYDGNHEDAIRDRPGFQDCRFRSLISRELDATGCENQGSNPGIATNLASWSSMTPPIWAAIPADFLNLLHQVFRLTVGRPRDTLMPGWRVPSQPCLPLSLRLIPT